MATVIHVDMDAFFASVEQSRHPEWRGKPVIVGSGPHERGVVSTCSYEARRFGVHSAMPSRTAYAKCPHAIFVRPHMDLYEEVSAKAFRIFESFTPYVEGVSIDEAFLDVTGSLHLHGNGDPAQTAMRIAEKLRAAVRRECGVTCSAGVAPNRLLAKIGSEQNKPDGATLMPFEPKAIAEFLAPKPVRILWGVGHHVEEALAPYAIRTCGDIQRIPEEQLARILGSRTSAGTLRAYAFGMDESSVEWEPTEEKSVSREHTFDTDESDREAIRATLLRLVAEVGRRFRTERRWANTARIKVRNADFETFTRQAPFDAQARDDITFRERAPELFDGAIRPTKRLSSPIRLIGFGVTNIQDTPDIEEPTLFADPAADRRKKRERLSKAMDALRDKGIIC